MGDEVAIDHYRIRLEPLNGDALDQLISCWSPEGKFDPRAAAKIAFQPFSRLSLNQNPDPIRSIISSVRRRWGAVAVYESPYMDGEFWDSHAGLYEWSFKPFAITCSRLHFFSTSTTHVPKRPNDGLAERICEAFTDGLTWRDVVSRIGDDLEYRGYCVLRPISSFVVSRTAISFDHRPIDQAQQNTQLHQAETDNGGQPILCVRQKCRAHLLNARLDLMTTEFIQQDPHLGPCATASLWVATRRIGAVGGGTASYPFSQITHQALGVLSAAKLVNVAYDPNAGDLGLTGSQIKQAIAQTGGHCFECSPKKLLDSEGGAARAARIGLESLRLRLAIFTFVDSGYPALLCATGSKDPTGHVVSAIGYLRPDRAHRPRSSIEECLGIQLLDDYIPRHYSLSGAIRVYYAHDDRYGPFSRVVFDQGGKSLEGVLEQGEPGNYCRPRFTLGRCPEEEMRLARVIVPLPPGVRNRLEGSLIDALKVFDAEYPPHILSDVSVLWRSSLVLGAQFKASLVGRGYPSDIVKGYASVHLPKYIWVFEFVLCDSKWQEVPWPARIHGEFLYDATVPYHEVHLLARRVGDDCWDCREQPSLLPGLQESVVEVDSIEGARNGDGESDGPF